MYQVYIQYFTFCFVLYSLTILLYSTPQVGGYTLQRGKYVGDVIGFLPDILVFSFIYLHSVPETRKFIGL
jgi:hypothetical protein